MVIQKFYAQATKVWNFIKVKVATLLVTKMVFLILGNPSALISPTFKINLSVSIPPKVTTVNNITNITTTNVTLIQMININNTSLNLDTHWERLD